MGGMVDTLDTPYGLVERAANAVIASALVEEVAAEIGVELVPALPSARRRFIYREGAARRWPLRSEASLRLLRSFAPRFLLRRATLAPKPGESVADWGQRTLGEEATQYLLAPALNGVYAGDPKQMSATLILGRLFAAERPRIPRGKWRGSVAPRTGMREWPARFRAFLEAKGVLFVHEPAEIPTLVALPPPQAAAFLHDRAPLLAEHLRQIRMLPLASVTAFYPPGGLVGFGCLFPRPEKFSARGVLFNDCIFPGRVAAGARSENWIFGGAQDWAAAQVSDSVLLERLRQDRARLMGVDTEPFDSHVTRWPKAIPHYDLTLERVIGELRSMQFREGPYELFGTYLGDLGLGRVLARARETARRYA
jgi:oxygen-dependent protoporphyrinogen oxidase